MAVWVLLGLWCICALFITPIALGYILVDLVLEDGQIVKVLPVFVLWLAFALLPIIIFLRNIRQYGIRHLIAIIVLLSIVLMLASLV